MSRYIPVEPEKWGEMVKALSEVERLRKVGDRIEEALREMPGDYPRCLANEWKAVREGKQP